MDDDGGGVPMICATSVMKPGRARIGKIGGNITLPRTIPLVNLFATAIGAFLGFAASLLVGGADALVIGLGVGAGAGWMAVTYSPLKNESLLKWFELKFKSQTRTRYVNGRRVTVAVGTAVITAPSTGTVLLLRSAVRVPAGQYDERGAVRSNNNRNIDSITGDRALSGAGRTPAAGAVPLPADPAAPTRRGRRGYAPAPAAPSRARQPAPTPDRGDSDPMAGPARRLKD